MKLALVYSLLTMKQSWIDSVLDGNEYNDHKLDAIKYAQELREMDVSCMGLVGEAMDDTKGANYVRVLRAQNLDAYARVMRASANLLKESAMRKAKLSDALSWAEQGLELVKQIAEQDRTMRRAPEVDRRDISFMTSGTLAIEVSERLSAIILRVREDLARL